MILRVRSTQSTAASTPETPEDWYSVYFTDPADPASKSLRGGPDKHLAEAIRAARVSVDVAVLQLNLWSIRDALLEAHKRGVQVRMVTESDYLDGKEIGQLDGSRRSGAGRPARRPDAQ